MNRAAFALAATLATTALHAQTVGDVATAASACDSSGVVGLSDQLVNLQMCRMPGVFVSLVPHTNISPTASHVHAVMVAPAHDAVWAAAASVDLQINSAFRTLAEQYVLYHRSGCFTPARPGTSPHESGRALDLNNWDAAGVISAMSAAGCTHSYPTSDPVHFDCPGTDLSSDSVLTFQHLWNINNPGDVIAEDGSYGPMTEARLAASPAGGFANAGDCGTCTAHCEGTVMVGADCGRGDCGAFGATCANDAMGLRCVSVFCPATGDSDTCLSDGRIAHCSNGAISNPTACAAGQSCVASGGSAQCVLPETDAGFVDANVSDVASDAPGLGDASADALRRADAHDEALGADENGRVNGGCACHTGGTRPTRGLGLMPMLALAMIIRRTRRRSSMRGK